MVSIAELQKLKKIYGKNQLAEALGVYPDTITRWMADGLPEWLEEIPPHIYQYRPLKPEELSKYREEYGTLVLSELLGEGKGKVNRWCDGKEQIPAWLWQIPQHMLDRYKDDKH